MSQPSKPKYVTVADWDDRLPRGHASVGRRAAPCRAGSRARRVSLAPENGLGGRLRHRGRRHRVGPPPLRGHGRRLLAHRHRAGAASGRAERRGAPLRARRRLRLSPAPPASSTWSTTPACITPSATRISNSISTCYGASLGRARTISVWREHRRRRSRRGRGQVTEDEMHNELGRLFEFVHLRPTRLESADPSQSYAGWSCLMLRPLVGAK